MRAVSALAIALLLAGCSWFETPQRWSKAGVTPEQADADLYTCKEIAHAQESTDEKIDTDTAASMGDGTGAVDTELSQNMSSQRSGKRFSSTVASCMRELGYSPVR